MSLEVCELLNGDYAVIDRASRYICPVMLHTEAAARTAGGVPGEVLQF